MYETAACRTPDALRALLVRAVVAQAPRLLGLQCRIPSMRGYGLFDRAYWNYAVVPFPNARMQEASLTLALLFAHRDPANPYAGSPALREWAVAGMRAWAGIQLGSGAFNDLYPREHSYVASAFSGYAVAEAARVLGGDSLSGGVGEALLRCGRWLAAAAPSPVANQVCGAAAALAAIGALLGEDGLTRRAGELVRGVAARQSGEGWLPEYGGPDVGYLSVAVDYLGKYHAATADPAALEVARRALDFLAQLAHPDCSAGGEYGSRATEYLLPDGLAVFSPVCGSAAGMLGAFRRALASGVSAALPALDDKYLLFNAYTYLQAARRPFVCGEPAGTGGPAFRRFDECGLVVCRGDRLFLIANARKGGALYACWPGTGVSVHDSGLLFRGDGWWTGCLLGSSAAREATPSRIRCAGRMGPPLDNRTSLWRSAALGIASTLAGTTQGGARALKAALRRAVVGGAPAAGPPIERTIIPGGDGTLEVIDEGELPEGARTVLVGSRLETVYGESARYFTPSQLAAAARELDVREAAPGGRRFRIRRRMRPGAGGALSVELEAGK